MTPEQIRTLRDMSAKWRAEALRHKTHGDSYRVGQGWGLDDCADQLDALLASLEGRQEEKDDTRVDGQPVSDGRPTAANNEVSPALLRACHIEALRHMRDALETYAEWCGGVHDDLCPEDDTCACSVKWVNDGVNSTVRFLRAMEEAKATDAVDPVGDSRPQADHAREEDLELIRLRGLQQIYEEGIREWGRSIEQRQTKEQRR